MTTPLSGYSGTPLAKKLGIKAGTSLVTVAAPADYASWLGALPDGAVVKPHIRGRIATTVDIVHLFATERATLARELERLRGSMRADAAVWVSWPKRTAKVPTDITEDVIRTVALPMGWVDIKVCAVNEIWSGLKLVVRKELRG